MLNKITEILSRDTAELSSMGLVFLCIGVLLFVLLNIFFIRLGRAVVATSGKTSFTVVKIIMVALFPTILNIMALFKKDLPLTLVLIMTAVMSIIVVIWNFLTFGPLKGLLLSYLHIAGGIVAGLMIASFVLLAVVMIIMMFIKPFELPSTGTGGAAPEYVRSLNSGVTYYVQKNASGEMTIDTNGGIRVLRPGDYAGRYVDGFGGTYIACED